MVISSKFTLDRRSLHNRYNMARTGRPKTEKPKEHILSFRLKEEEFSQIKEYAARYNMTMTQIIEEAVKDYFNKQQTQN